MKIRRQTLSIAGIKMAVESELDFQFSDRCMPFVKKLEKVDVIFKIHEGKNINLNECNLETEGKKSRIYIHDTERIKIKYYDDNMTDIFWYMTENNTNPLIYNIGIIHKEILERINPMIFIELSAFMIRYNAMILHSSFIKYKECGILFSAPSQTGKSTQAELWRQYYGATIINGDRTIIRKENMYYGYGSPYAGSSAIYKNERAKINAIVILRQSKENKIRRMGLKEAYICLLSEMSVPSSRTDVVEKQSRWLLNMLTHIPVYLLECLPDKGAVDILYEELKEKFNGK